MRHLCVVAFKNKKICARDWSTSLFQKRLKQEEESHWKPSECGVPLFILSVFCPPSFFLLCSRHFPDERPWTKGEKRQQAGSALQSRDFHWVRWWVAFPLQPSNHIQCRDWRGARHIWSSLQLTPHWGGDGVGRVGTGWGWVGFYVSSENQAKLAVYARLTSTSFHQHMELFVEFAFPSMTLH